MSDQLHEYDCQLLTELSDLPNMSSRHVNLPDVDGLHIPSPLDAIRELTRLHNLSDYRRHSLLEAVMLRVAPREPVENCSKWVDAGLQDALLDIAVNPRTYSPLGGTGDQNYEVRLSPLVGVVRGANTECASYTQRV